MLDERREPVRPHVFAHDPIAEARVVVTAIAKPAIVEHVALNTELRGAIREILETVEVMIEVDGLPHVQGDGAVRVHVVLARAKPRVETLRDLVEAHAVARVDVRRLVAFAVREHDLAGEQSFAARKDCFSRTRTLHDVTVLARKARVQRPYLARRVGEAPLAHMHEERRIGPGAPAAILAQVLAHAHGQALRFALAGPAASKIKDFVRFRRHRERHRERLQPVVSLSAIGERAAHAHEPRVQ